MRFYSRTLAVAVPSMLIGVFLGVAAIGGVAALRGSSVFPDVSEGTYYDEAVGDMYNAGIIKGYSNGTFGPDDFVTRGQIAVMMKRLRDDVNGVSTVTTTTTSPRSSSSSSSSVAAASSAAASVAANEHGAFRFAMTSFSVPQTIATMVFSVSRSGGSKGDATVSYSVKGGTAVAGTDFTEVNNSVLSFKDGETTRTFTVQLKGKVSDNSRTVLLSLSNPTGSATLGSPNAATLTIIGSKPQGTTSSASSQSSSTSAGATATTPATIGFSATAYETAENAGSLLVTVVRTGITTNAVGVSYATADKTARNGTDYAATSGTLSFAAGETSKTFLVSVNNNDIVDGRRNLLLNLSAPTGGAVLDSLSSVPLYITDDETGTGGSGSLAFVSNSVTGVIGSNAVLIVSRVGGNAKQATVAYASSSMTAIGGRDFTAVSGTLTFAPGEFSKRILIPILSDSTNLSVSNKFFTVTLSNAVGAELASPYNASVNISS